MAFNCAPKFRDLLMAVTAQSYKIIIFVVPIISAFYIPEMMHLKLVFCGLTTLAHPFIALKNQEPLLLPPGIVDLVFERIFRHTKR